MELLVERLYRLASSQPEQPAIVARDAAPVTYSQLWEEVGKTRAALAGLGLKRGDRVILATARDFSFIYTYLALHALGIIAVPLDPRTSLSVFQNIQEQISASLVLWPDRAMPQSQEYSCLAGKSPDCSKPEANGAVLSDIMFTSGTTGSPKGVMLTQSNIATSINNINGYIGNGAADMEICPMPLSHSFGLTRLRCVLYAGGSILLEEGVRRPKQLFENMEKFNVTGIGLVAPAWRLLHKLSGDRISRFADQLRYLELGSAVLEPEHKRHLANLLPKTKVCMHYGLTEASRSAFLDFRADEEYIASVGKAGPLVEIAVFRPDGTLCSPNETGEVCVRGGMVTSGYLNRDQGEYFYPGGYFRTGDSGYLNKDGYLYLEGRIKEIINVGGEKVSPLEVEKHLTSIDGIMEAACIGKPDQVLGEVVVAFLVRDEDATIPDHENIRLILRKNLESFKIPVNFIEIDEIPRTNSGKVKRLALKELL